jgi:hypothetical protein
MQPTGAFMTRKRRNKTALFMLDQTLLLTTDGSIYKTKARSDNAASQIGGINMNEILAKTNASH